VLAGAQGYYGSLRFASWEHLLWVSGAHLGPDAGVVDTAGVEHAWLAELVEWLAGAGVACQTGEGAEWNG
jgi:hypothetical protein